MRPRYVIALAVALLLAFWTTGRADPALARWGLNFGDCYHFLGDYYCGDAAKRVKTARDNIQTALPNITVNADQLQADVRSAVPSAEAYYADHGTYHGISSRELRRDYDSALPADVKAGGTRDSYCIQAAGGGLAYHFDGPGGEVPTVPNGPC